MADTAPQELWNLAHPAKSYEVHCVLNPHARELRVVTSEGNEVLREVHDTTAIACERAEQLKGRLIAGAWHIALSGS